jgi:hypothetical protein
MKYGELVAATSHCVNTGDVRIAHCRMLLGNGEKELAAHVSCTAPQQMSACGQCPVDMKCEVMYPILPVVELSQFGSSRVLKM